MLKTGQLQAHIDSVFLAWLLKLLKAEAALLRNYPRGYHFSQNVLITYVQSRKRDAAKKVHPVSVAKKTLREKGVKPIFAKIEHREKDLFYSSLAFA